MYLDAHRSPHLFPAVYTNGTSDKILTRTQHWSWPKSCAYVKQPNFSNVPIPRVEVQDGPKWCSYLGPVCLCPKHWTSRTRASLCICPMESPNGRSKKKVWPFVQMNNGQTIFKCQICVRTYWRKDRAISGAHRTAVVFSQNFQFVCPLCICTMEAHI